MVTIAFCWVLRPTYYEGRKIQGEFEIKCANLTDDSFHHVDHIFDDINSKFESQIFRIFFFKNFYYLCKKYLSCSLRCGLQQRFDSETEIESSKENINVRSYFMIFFADFVIFFLENDLR